MKKSTDQLERAELRRYYARPHPPILAIMLALALAERLITLAVIPEASALTLAVSGSYMDKMMR
jgi:hypothetical protein